MRRFKLFLITVAVALSLLTLGGCGILDLFGEFEITNEDLEAVLPSELPEAVIPEQDKDYYRSDDVDLWFECNGYFDWMDYFYVDPAQPTKRIYDNMYFYEDDYFYMLSDNMVHWYASLSDGHSRDYVTEELADGEEYSIKFKRDGIYRIVFDVQTTRFDVERKGDIDTPRYYRIPDCDILSTDGEFYTMTPHPTDPDLLVYEGLQVTVGEGITFLEELIHTSTYKVTVAEDCRVIFANTPAGERDTYVECAVGGSVNVTLNTLTYEVGIRPVDAERAEYGIMACSKEIDPLLKQSAEHPYLFYYDMEVTDFYTNHPHTDFYNINVEQYPLTCVESEYFKPDSYGNFYCTTNGLNRVYINVLEGVIYIEYLGFEISA